MKKFFSNKWTWIGIAVIILVIVIIKKNKAKAQADAIKKKSVSGDDKFGKVLASLTADEKAVWGKVDSYKFSDEETKMMKDEAGAEKILKEKVKLTDAEIDTFDNIVKKFAVAGIFE